MAQDTYGLAVKFRLLQGHGAAFDALVAETVEVIHAEEPGTLVYLTHVEDSDPNSRVFYELYRDREAFEAHEAGDHVRHFLAEREAHLSRPPEVWRVSARNGHVRPLPADLHG